MTGGKLEGGAADDRSSLSQGEDVGRCVLCSGKGEEVKGEKSGQMRLVLSKETR